MKHGEVIDPRSRCAPHHGAHDEGPYEARNGSDSLKRYPLSLYSPDFGADFTDSEFAPNLFALRSSIRSAIATLHVSDNCERCSFIQSRRRPPPGWMDPHSAFMSFLHAPCRGPGSASASVGTSAMTAMVKV